MGTTQGWSDGPVDPSAVATFVRNNLPLLRGDQIRFLSLSDFSTWEIDGRYILRFARDDGSNAQLTREVAALPVLERALPVEVPRVDLVAFYSEGRQVMGYPKVAGVDGETFRPGPDRRSHLVNQFAELLIALRGLPASALHPDTPQWPGYDLEGNQSHLAKCGHLVEEQMPDLLTPEVLRYVRGEIELAAPSEAPAVVSHADIKGEHLLFNVESGRLTAVIDWADMCVTQPTFDLGFLAIWLGPKFVSDVAEKIGTPSDDADHAVAGVRLAMLAGLALTLAGEKHWPMELAKTMIRWAFAADDE